MRHDTDSRPDTDQADRRLRTEDLLPGDAGRHEVRAPQTDEPGFRESTQDGQAHRDDPAHDGPGHRGTARHDTIQHETDQHDDTRYDDTPYDTAQDTRQDTAQYDDTQQETARLHTDRPGAGGHETDRYDEVDGDEGRGTYREAAPTDEIPLPERGSQNDEEAGAELFSAEEIDRFRAEWQAVQTNFVDDPREAVRNADHLVAQVMQALATTFTEHKRELEGQWQGGEEAHTEDLRLALRRYRSFFNQLLHA